MVEDQLAERSGDVRVTAMTSTHGARAARHGLLTWVITATGDARAFYDHLGAELLAETAVPMGWHATSSKAGYGWRDLAALGRRVRVASHFTMISASALPENNNDHQGRHQRLRPHRPQHPARALRGRQEARHRDRRDQRPGQPRDQRAPDALRHRARQVSRQGRGRRRLDGRQRRPHQGVRAARSGEAAVGRRSASTSCSSARASSRPRRRRRRTCKGGAKKVIISAPGGKDVDATIVYGVNHEHAEGGAHGDLERLVHDQLPGAAGQAAARRRSASSTA